MPTFKNLLCTVFFASCFTFLHAQIPTFQEVDGLVVVEVESFLAGQPQWPLDTAISGFSGSGYAVYQGSDRFNAPTGGVHAFDIAFAKTGVYRFEWRSRISKGTSISEHNDSWFRINGGQNTFAERGGRILYPRGSGRTPNPEGSGVNGWYKVYQNNLGNWTWNTRTSDNDPHEIYFQVDSAGTYRMEVSARSDGHAIDRIIFFHSDITPTVARNLNQPESNTIVSSSQEVSPFDRATLFPNPADSQVTFQSEALIGGQLYTAEVLDAQGKLSRKQQVVATSKQLEVDVQPLPTGVYFLRIAELKGVGEVRFLKQ